VKENSGLRDKLSKLKDYIVTSESDQLADREKMIRLINDRSNISRLTDNIDVLVQVDFTSTFYTSAQRHWRNLGERRGLRGVPPANEKNNIKFVIDLLTFLFVLTIFFLC